MVYILEIIEVFFVAQQADAEQTVTYNVERLNHRFLDILDVIDMLYLQRECFRIVDSLHRVTLVRQFYACKQRRVGSNCHLDSLTESFFVQTAVEDIETRYIVAGLPWVVYTFHVESILRFS